MSYYEREAKRRITKTVYDVKMTHETLLPILTDVPKDLKIEKYASLRIWIELNDLLLITADKQDSMEQGMALLLKLYTMRGKAMLLFKIICGASWIEKPTNTETDTVFKGDPNHCLIKFQAVEVNTGKKKKFIMESKIYDLDDVLSGYNVEDYFPSQESS